MKFLMCKRCGNVVTYLSDKYMPMICCADMMIELEPGTEDAAAEKHVPVVDINGKTVKINVRSVDHPMTDAHFIKWIVLQTRRGFQVRYLTPIDRPEVTFTVTEGDNPLAAYAYCNLHGLWEQEI